MGVALWECYSEVYNGGQNATGLRVMVPDLFTAWVLPALSSFSARSGIPINATVVPAAGLLAAISSEVEGKPPTEQHPLWLHTAAYTQHLADEGLLTDLSMLVSQQPYQLAWADVSQMYRLQLATYQGRTVSIPLDGGMAYLFSRRDVLGAMGVQPPHSWTELLDFGQRFAAFRAANATAAAAFPAHAFCVPLSTSCRHVTYLQAIWTSIAQTRGSEQGVLFSISDLTPLIDSPAAREAFRTISLILDQAAPPDPHDDCNHASLAFAHGACAVALGGLVPTLQMFTGRLVNAPVPMSSIRVSRLPGSELVWDRDGSGGLVPCTPKLCPLAELAPSRYGSGQPSESEPGRLINFTPQSILATLTGGINSRAPVLGQMLSLAVLFYLGSPDRWSPSEAVVPPVAVEPVRDAFVPSQDTRALYEAAGWEASVLTEAQGLVMTARNHPNRGWPLRMPHAIQYTTILTALMGAMEDRFPAPCIRAGAGGLQSGQVTLCGTDLDTLLAAAKVQLAAHYDPAEFLPKYKASLGITPAPSSPAPAPDPAPAASSNSGGSKSAVVVPAVVIPVTLLLLGLGACFVARSWNCRSRKLYSRPPRVGDLTAMLVTDIEGSTTLWEALPEEVMARALSLHHRTVRRLLVKHAGYESSTEGDSFILAFAAAHKAVAFGTELQGELLAQAWPQELLQHPACLPIHSALPDCFPFARALDHGPPKSVYGRLPAVPGWELGGESPTLCLEGGGGKREEGRTLSTGLMMTGHGEFSPLATSAPLSPASRPASGAAARSAINSPMAPYLTTSPASAPSNAVFTSTVLLPAIGSDKELEDVDELHHDLDPSELSPWREGLPELRAESGQGPATSTGGGELPAGAFTSCVLSPSNSGYANVTSEVRPDEQHDVDVDWAVTASTILPTLATNLFLEPSESFGTYLKAAGAANACPTEPVKAKKGRLLFRGLRVRVGVTCARLTAAELQYNTAAARMVLGGPALAAAKALADLAHGGQVLLSCRAHEQLREELPGSNGRPSGVLLLKLASLLTPPEARNNTAASCCNLILSGSLFPADAALPSEASTVLWATSPPLAARLALWPQPLRGAEAMTPVNVLYDAPVGRATYVVVQVQGAVALRAWDGQVALQALQLYRSTARDLLQRLRGSSLFQSDLGAGEDELHVAFADPVMAVRWAEELRAALLRAPWPQALLEHELGEPLEAITTTRASHDAAGPLSTPTPSAQARSRTHSGAMALTKALSIASGRFAKATTTTLRHGKGLAVLLPSKSVSQQGFQTPLSSMSVPWTRPGTATSRASPGHSPHGRPPPAEASSRSAREALASPPPVLAASPESQRAHRGWRLASHSPRFGRQMESSGESASTPNRPGVAAGSRVNSRGEDGWQRGVLAAAASSFGRLATQASSGDSSLGAPTPVHARTPPRIPSPRGFATPVPQPGSQPGSVTQVSSRVGTGEFGVPSSARRRTVPAVGAGGSLSQTETGELSDLMDSRPTEVAHHRLGREAFSVDASALAQAAAGAGPLRGGGSHPGVTGRTSGGGTTASGAMGGGASSSVLHGPIAGVSSPRLATSQEPEGAPSKELGGASRLCSLTGALSMQLPSAPWPGVERAAQSPGAGSHHRVPDSMSAASRHSHAHQRGAASHLETDRTPSGPHTAATSPATTIVGGLLTAAAAGPSAAVGARAVSSGSSMGVRAGASRWDTRAMQVDEEAAAELGDGLQTLLLRGLRVRAGIATGRADWSLSTTSHSLCYVGRLVAAATKLAGAASAGQVLCDAATQMAALNQQNASPAQFHFPLGQEPAQVSFVQLTPNGGGVGAAVLKGRRKARVPAGTYVCHLTHQPSRRGATPDFTGTLQPLSAVSRRPGTAKSASSPQQTTAPHSAAHAAPQSLGPTPEPFSSLGLTPEPAPPEPAPPQPGPVPRWKARLRRASAAAVALSAPLAGIRLAHRRASAGSIGASGASPPLSGAGAGTASAVGSPRVAATLASGISERDDSGGLQIRSGADHVSPWSGRLPWNRLAASPVWPNSTGAAVDSASPVLVAGLNGGGLPSTPTLTAVGITAPPPPPAASTAAASPAGAGARTSHAVQPQYQARSTGAAGLASGGGGGDFKRRTHNPFQRLTTFVTSGSAAISSQQALSNSAVCALDRPTAPATATTGLDLGSPGSGARGVTSASDLSLGVPPWAAAFARELAGTSHGRSSAAFAKAVHAGADAGTAEGGGTSACGSASLALCKAPPFLHGSAGSKAVSGSGAPPPGAGVPRVSGSAGEHVQPTSASQPLVLVAMAPPPAAASVVPSAAGLPPPPSLAPTQRLAAAAALSPIVSSGTGKASSVGRSAAVLGDSGGEARGSAAAGAAAATAAAPTPRPRRRVEDVEPQDL
ncbi:hypothetical protein HYH03_006024 [Edaphochlamys debaryana]|uniref:Guanylate cyclase domain-containing protein n=1 Tax=Edaphochlamys debaryana TaxID=47281 RepID=A0A835Y5Z1_9CHLO|nr:hypothetical protein HYH03_006024 [Edaphochlamys debaryana]|eukprot:KAG2495779.1 hypothetical protein HYH03_006024 [Edaphochlamys debaryana]